MMNWPIERKNDKIPIILKFVRFVYILDNEGKKIALWEPNDPEYEKLVEGRTK